MVFSENWNLRSLPRGKLTDPILTPEPLIRTVVAIAYRLLGRLEFTCRPAGIDIAITPRAVEPLETAPPPIEPEIVWECIAPTDAATMIKAFRIKKYLR